MLNILWFCNRPIEEAPDKRDGTWFTAMGTALIEKEKIRLSIISQAKVKSIINFNYGNIQQWVIPYESLRSNGLPSKNTITEIQRIVDKLGPDLIHIWGTENFWGLLSARKLFDYPALLEIQGLKYACARYYHGGLSLNELFGCIGPLDFFIPKRSFLYGKRRFSYWGKFEKEMILSHKYISTQSNWVREHIKILNPDCILFETGIILRKQFYSAQPWFFKNRFSSNKPIIFAYSALSQAYKGFHILIRAVAILKREYPNITLNIAGDIIRTGIRKRGYSKWLLNEVQKLGIKDNVNWLGPLDANEIIQQLHQASLVVIPSFIESYSVALAEAMIIGVPVVASYAGAMSELAKDGESALFFQPGDEVACAMQIRKILKDKTLAECLAKDAREIGLKRNDPSSVIEQQIKIYEEVIKREYDK